MHKLNFDNCFLKFAAATSTEENQPTSTDSATRLKRDTAVTMTDKNSTEKSMYPGMP